MNDYIRQITENRKHLSFDSAEEKAYFALADYNVNPPDFEKIRSEITHYEYSKGGMTFGGIYAPSIFSHLLVDNSRGKRCTERAAYNFQYGFDKNDNLIYVKTINIQTEFGYTEWINEIFYVILPDEIRTYQFQINGSDGSENRFDYFRLISTQDGKIKSNVYVYSADRILDYEHFHTETEYYNYENGEITSIDTTRYTQFLLGHMMSGIDMGNIRSHNDIKPKDRITSGKAFELIGMRGMAAAYGDKNSAGNENKMQKLSNKKSDVLYRIIQKYITEKFIPETKKTAVRLKAKRGKTKATDTKFGGKPYIPKGFSYPCIKGEPMALICQLNFAEIPHLEGYPESGLLQIYLEIDETSMFESESYKIFYHTDISGKNCYKNPFGKTKKATVPTNYMDYFSTIFTKYEPAHLGKISDLFSKSGRLMMSNNGERLQKLLDELAATYVEYREFDEAKFKPLSAEDEKLIKAFNNCTDYLINDPDTEDAKPISELIDDLYFKSEKKPAGTYLDDIFPLSEDKEYKIKAELFEMPFTPDVDGFFELFFEKIITFFTENHDFVSSDNEREIINEFIEMLRNDNSSDPSKLLFDIFPYGEYDYIFELLSASSLDEYDKYGACLVGGFPHFTQGDYRPKDYSELLLQIDSFDYNDGYENTVMWGDGGVINFFIKPENLKNADFSDVYIGGDCS
jgi:uncharacterized protein YwqG